MAFPHRPRSGQFEEVLNLNEETLTFIREHLNDDVPTLALKKAPVGTDFSLALRQIEARQLLQKKAPEWSANEALLFPARRSIEQCSSEATARYKAELVEGDNFADLTGGLGIDTYYILQGFSHGDYVESQPELCALARHNFAVLATPVNVHNETTETFLNHCDTYDCLYIDPSRRDAYGRKTVSIGDCAPNVAELQDALLQKATTVIIKLSPMLDLSLALTELRCVKEIHVVAVANECKELVFRIERGYSGQVRLHCANLLTQQPIVTFTTEEERDCPLRLADSVGRYLFEPNAALLKAGCFKLPASRFEARKLHKNSHLYTSDTLIEDFPGRIFAVEAVAPFNKKVRQTLLPDLEKANLAVRNFPLSVAELRKTLKISEGGDAYVFATTLRGDERALIRTKKATSCEAANKTK